jgi:hypothetical protein
MKRMRLYGFGLLGVLAAACGGSDNQVTQVDSTTLKAGATADPGEACGPGMTPCGDGRICASIQFSDGPTSPSCFPADVCNSLECGDGQCVIAESYPARVGCSIAGGGGGDNGTGARKDAGRQD